MHRWLQSLIVCLLALALPGQGMAAATMIHCAQAHQRLQAAAGHPDLQASAGHGRPAPHAHASHAHASHAHASHGHASHGHAATQAHPSDHGASTGFDPAQPDAAAEVGPNACSACASCCAGIGLSSAPLQVPEHDAAMTVFVTVVPAVDAFAADGPDRPPRIVFA
jgi:hypothetical protein